VITETNQPKTRTEEIQIRGTQMLEKVNELIAAGNVRRIVVKHDGKTLVEVPLTVGVIGTLLAPPVAVLGVVAALVTDCSLVVVRTEETGSNSHIEVVTH
jgi:uncharacterized protein DUF4342